MTDFLHPPSPPYNESRFDCHISGVGGWPPPADTYTINFVIAPKKGLQDHYSKLAEQAAQFLPINGVVPTETDIGTARIRAAQLAGYDLRRDSTGAMHVQISGRWLPL